MRKIIVFAMITLDGVMQSPGGMEEDPSDGFTYGGWVFPYWDDEFQQAAQGDFHPADYLLGRKTFSIWADYWPDHGDFWPAIMEGTKYVFSKNLSPSDPRLMGWKNSVVISDLEEIKKLKSDPPADPSRPDFHVWGSSKLIQLLMQHDLVDEFRLKIYPLTLGKGVKLFDHGTIPAAFTLTQHVVTPKGVIIATFQRAGEVETGTMGV
ncbi:MAG: dihydrofolate reductase family protein [Bacteroidia bacterium]|nr:dihydrofolate reductase family protein [Bacteroidia bacterium]